MRGLFILHLLLAGLWLVLTESYTGLNFAVGFVIGYVVVVLFGRATENSHYSGMIWRLVRFSAYFLTILFKATVEVAMDVLTPPHHMKPRIIRYDVSDLTLVQTVTLSNAISLTPGTLSADISDDAAKLYIHCMYAADRDAAVAAIDDLKSHLMRDVFLREDAA
ncbi:MAG: Na+/H+ antiporter subunit E [Phycisphaeraceae bacterium]